jgi:hypothetical protein
VSAACHGDLILGDVQVLKLVEVKGFGYCFRSRASKSIIAQVEMQELTEALALSNVTHSHLCDQILIQDQSGQTLSSEQ